LGIMFVYRVFSNTDTESKIPPSMMASGTCGSQTRRICGVINPLVPE
jgi:hypothetical protein